MIERNWDKSEKNYIYLSEKEKNKYKINDELIWLNNN